MRVLFVGTGTVIPGNNRFPTSIFIKSSGTQFLLDIGPGILSRLGQFGIIPHTLDAVFVSHFHLDHISDLATLLFISKIKQIIPPIILGPKGISEWIERAGGLYGSQIKGNFPLTIKEVEPGETMSLKNLNLSFFKTNHTEESIGVIVETENKRLIYTSDTSFNSNLTKILPPNPDILITECSLPHQVEGHMDPDNLARLAQMLNPNLLAVVHLYPLIEPDRIRISLERFWNGKVIFPHEGSVIDI